MAGGRGILDANGKLLIRSDGTVDVCEDCCNVYSRWHKCGSETGEIYTRDSDSAPNPFKRLADGLCWSRVSTGQALPGGATLLEPADWTTDAGCCVCDACDDPLPSTISITFSGVNIVGPCMRRFASNSWSASAYSGPDVNDTFVMSAACDVTHSIGTASSLTVKLYSSSDCTGSFVGDTPTNKEVSVRIQFQDDGTILLNGSVATVGNFFCAYVSHGDDCFDNTVISNECGTGTATLVFS